MILRLIKLRKNVELLFDCHNYLDEKKIKLVVIKFTDNAIIWRD